MQYICEFQIIKKLIIHKVNNNLNFLLTRFFSLLLKTEQYRITFIELKNK